jgi:putative transposase
MANTYTQIHLQLIFGVKYREALIDPNWETELHKYISEIIMKYKFNW